LRPLLLCLTLANNESAYGLGCGESKATPPSTLRRLRVVWPRPGKAALRPRAELVHAACVANQLRNSSRTARQPSLTWQLCQLASSRAPFAVGFRIAHLQICGELACNLWRELNRSNHVAE